MSIESYISMYVLLFMFRDIDHGACEMVCWLKINPEVLRLCIPYKYVVYSPKTRNAKRYELLRLHCDNSGKPVNRVLNLSSALRTEGAYTSYYWFMHDSMVCM